MLTYYQEILKDGLPPKGKYLSVYKNSLVISGQPDNVNNVSFSLAASELTKLSQQKEDLKHFQMLLIK